MIIKRIYTHQYLARKLEEFSQKDINWLHAYICTKNNQELIERSSQEQKEFCINFVLKNGVNFDKLLEIKSEEILSDQDYDWIRKDDYRFFYWSRKILDNELFNHYDILSNQDLYLSFCLSIDLSLNQLTNKGLDANYTISRKKDTLNRIKSEWEVWYTITSPFNEWLSQQDKLKKEKLKWCFEYLSKMNIPLTFKSLPYKAIKNDQELISHILIIIDNMNFKSKDEYTLFLQRLKRSYTQYKFRLSGNQKKEYHLPLTISAKDKLLKLSKLEGISENKMIENLINQAFELNKEYFN